MKKRVFYSIILFLFSIFFITARQVSAEEIYQIDSQDAWDSFINKVQNDGETYKDSVISLDTDLIVEGKEFSSPQRFEGTFLGNGHLLTFLNEDLRNTSAVFPFQILGTIKDLNIYVKDCKVDATKHPTVTASVLMYAAGNIDFSSKIENINIYGNIKIIPEPSRNNNIECSVINASYAQVRNCIVSVTYDLEVGNLKDFINNETKRNFRVRLFQYGGKSTYEMALMNSYSRGNYSESFIGIKNELEEYYDKKTNELSDEFFLVSPVGLPSSQVNNNTIDNFVFDNDISPVILLGKTIAKDYVKENFLSIEDVAKTSEELKKQETYVDYDFDNVWGISEYINDGYPYLKTLFNKDLVELVNQIIALPKEDEITKDSKEAVKKIKEALAGLSEQDKALISFDVLSDRVTKAEEAIKAIEEKEKEDGKTQPQEPTTISVKKGTKFTVKGYKYTVTGTSIKNPTVSITGYKNKKLKKISIPATVTYQKVVFKVNAIGNNAFKGQKKATAVIVGKNIASIGKASFAGDAKVKKITVKSVVLKKVGAKAFKGIHKKAVIKVPKKQVKAYKKLMKNKGQAKTVKIK